MKNILLLNKPLGYTPLQTLEAYKKTHSEYKDVKMGYAGRLDPMAEGLLLVLLGDENKKRKEYERLPKAYEFQVLLGVETDSYDLLGMITGISLLSEYTNKRLKSVIKKFRGKHLQPYPIFSAARVHGKPLYYWAREGKIEVISVPQKEIEILSLELIKNELISRDELQRYITTTISLVKGKFRQTQILKQWEEFLTLKKIKKFQLLTLRVECSSGTYIRTLACQLGKDLNSHGLAFSIKRTRIGLYLLAKADYVER